MASPNNSETILSTLNTTDPPVTFKKPHPNPTLSSLQLISTSPAIKSSAKSANAKDSLLYRPLNLLIEVQSITPWKMLCPKINLSITYVICSLFSLQSRLFQYSQSEKTRYSKAQGLCGFGNAKSLTTANIHGKKSFRTQSLSLQITIKICNAQIKKLCPGKCSLSCRKGFYF